MWRERLCEGLRISKNITIYHAPITKQVLVLNRGKPIVAHRTLKSFGKCRKMGEISLLCKNPVFFPRPKWGANVWQTDKVSGAKKTQMGRGHVAVWR